jgi:alkylhydroperoxidase family enzyme
MCLLALLPESGWGKPPHVAVPSNAEAWAALPPAEEGPGKPLPAWVRALAPSLPKTAAAMLELDYAQRAESTLPPRLRARLRWTAADANRCDYAKAYARADFKRAGGKAAELDTSSERVATLPEGERLAVEFVLQLSEAAYTVTDAQVARLVALYGETQVVGMALVAAYASFQDRLLLAMGVELEPDGPLPPVAVRFRKPTDSKDKPAEKPQRRVSPPAEDPPAVATHIDDPEWIALPYDSLQERLSRQIKRPRARIPIPDWETVRKNLPASPRRSGAPLRIRWSLLNYGYQPRLALAWNGGLRAFRDESDLPVVYQESLFWVVTRSLQCFY